MYCRAYVGDRPASASRMKPLDAQPANFVRSKRDRICNITALMRGVRRALPDVVAFVHGADRASWSRDMCGEVVERVSPPIPRKVSTMSSAMATLVKTRRGRRSDRRSV